MSRALLFAILCVAAALPSVSGTASLVPKLSSAGCSGHFSELKVTSVTCDYSTNGCTYGSDVFITGQVTADADLPRPMKASVYKTLPTLYGLGMKTYSGMVEDLCESGALTAYPDTDDAADSCPGAGLYNFVVKSQITGTRQSWYAGWSGYTFGMEVHFKHEGGGSDYGTCHINVQAQKGADDSYATNATFVSVATLGLACVGVFVKRRKQRLAATDESQSEDRTKELATNFELVQDSRSSMV